MIWKNSKKLGIGEAYGSVVINRKTLRCKYTVAWYQPAGNVPGQYKDNVLKATANGNECDSVSTMLTDANFDNERQVKLNIMNDSIFNADILKNDERNRPSVGKEEKSTNDDNDNKNDSFQQFHLDAHNKYRKVHNAPSMTLNSQMSKEAEEYAKKLAKMGGIKHSPKEERNGHGENLAMSCSENGDLKDDFATKNW